MGGRAGNCDHGCNASSINDCCRVAGTEKGQADADGEILCIGRGGDNDGIAGRSQRDRMPDGLAGGCSRAGGTLIPPVWSRRCEDGLWSAAQ